MKRYIKSSSQPEFDEVIGWLAEHDQVYNDCCDYFGVRDLDELDEDSYEDLIDWIADHDMLYQDFEAYFR